MLKEIDLKLISLLDNYIDKTVSPGCIIHSHKGYGFYYYTLINEINYGIDDYHFSIEPYKCEIIGHYPTTNTIIRYIGGNLSIKDNVLIIQKGDVFSNLDITKEIIDYTDKEKQELFNFLNNL